MIPDIEYGPEDFEAILSLKVRTQTATLRRVKRVLSEGAQAGGAETLTDALAAWTTGFPDYSSWQV